MEALDRLQLREQPRIFIPRSRLSLISKATVI